MKNDKTYAVILAGGRSSRLFPFNKVLSDLTGSGRSLIQQARDRLASLSDRQVYVLTVLDMVSPMQRQLRLPRDHFFAGPVRRGTWPALLWAMAHLRQKNAQAVMAVITGDQVIRKPKEFQKALAQGVRIAQKEAAFVAIPVRPSGRPEEWTGFGAFKGPDRIFGFEEKPTLDRAKEMIQEGGWSWNAGMFFFRISVAEEVLRERQPQQYTLYSQMAEALARKKPAAAKKIFATFPEKIIHPVDLNRQVDNTIDYAVMMPLVIRPSPVASVWRTSQALTGWTDLGQWTAIRQVAKADSRGNIQIGDVRLGPGVKDSILVAEPGHRIEISGLKGMIVALAGGKALVLPQSEVGRVKELVSNAKSGSQMVAQESEMSSFVMKKKGKIVILSNKLKEAI